MHKHKNGRLTFIHYPKDGGVQRVWFNDDKVFAEWLKGRTVSIEADGEIMVMRES